jgi:peptide/nickel transport system ATP-binding protein
MTAVLSVENLSVRLPRGADRELALNDVSLTLHANDILCVVGESGSGKSMLSNAITGLLPPEVTLSAGHIRFGGEDLTTLPEDRMRRIRGRQIAMIFQEPMTALNPLHRVGDQIAEMFRTHTEFSAREIRQRVLGLLEDVRLPDPARALRAYPHELSGGQRQRAMIAMALALEPAILIADEPTTALDVTTQAHILAMIRDIRRRKGMAVLFITHDFGVVADIADRVAVMQHGVVVEQGAAEAVLTRPAHPYTKTLIAAVPSLVPRAARPQSSEAVLTIAQVSKTYRRGGFFTRTKGSLALDNVSVILRRGSTLGIVGESGSGKSTLARCIVRLLDPDSGSIRLGDIDLASLSRAKMRQEANRIQMVFQDPFGSLNPRRRVGELVGQGPMLRGVSREQAMLKARELFTLVGLDPDAVTRYPHEFSGGQRQRIGIARALALEPEVLVADEPVSALDVSVQAQVLRLLADLRERLGLSMLFITHDLRVAAQICDRIAVMKDGKVVEEGATPDVFLEPRHEYTKALLAAVPGRSWGMMAAETAS